MQDGASFENSKPLIAVSFFRKTLHLRSLTGFGYTYAIYSCQERFTRKHLKAPRNVLENNPIVNLIMDLKFHLLGVQMVLKLAVNAAVETVIF